MSDDQRSEEFSALEYLAVPTGSLINYKTAISDIFVRLPSQRMVRIAHKGEVIDMARIDRFGDKDVQVLYVYKTDFDSVVTELVRNAVALSNQKGTSDEKLGRFFSVAESVYTELLRLPLTTDSFDRAVQVTGYIGEQMTEKPDFRMLLRSVVTLGDDFSRHSLGTVVMSNMMMVPLGWKNAKLVQPITMGAFFHDIGLKDIPEELRFKSRVEMTKEETAVWETHPAIGAHLLNSMHTVSAETIRIVMEHHEVPNGTGFPNKYRLDRMYPMAKVVSLSNMLAHDIFDPQKDDKPFSIDGLVDKIDLVYSQMFGNDLAKAARSLFRKAEVSKPPSATPTEPKSDPESDGSGSSAA
ncbi:MAG: HD-GYP domain-containing protein [Bdellovibrionales bacterium]